MALFDRPPSDHCFAAAQALIPLLICEKMARALIWV
jgi:hypothetical protein